MANFNIIYDTDYYDDTLDLKFLMMNDNKINFYLFGVEINRLLTSDHEWAYDETKSFFTEYIKNINELLLNEKDSKLTYDGQGPFMTYNQFEITPTSDSNTYNFCNECKKINLVISRDTLVNMRNIFQTILSNVDELLHNKLYKQLKKFKK